jgi:myo-inositol-1(or 4)-monophosphatase
MTQMTADELALRRHVAEEAAKAGGTVHLRYAGHALERDVHEGNRADYTTVADLEAQEAVKQTIARHFPDDIVVGEEDIELRTRIGDLLQDGCWLTDPLDGTQEYAHGNPAVSCIVGYAQGGQPWVGAAYFAVWDELFSASQGMGATLNGSPIRVNNVTRLQEALFAAPQVYTNTPGGLERFAHRMSKPIPNVEGFRMPGAQTYMVCGVAAGRYDVTSVINPRLELPTSRPYHGAPWETIALVVLVQEAGGAVASLDGGAPDLLSYNVYAASRALLDEYVALMSE